MSDDLTFTGERLHEGDTLFGVDLAQHRAAYRFVIERGRGGRLLDLGSGTGYGTRELAQAGLRVVALDRVAPLASSRCPGASFVRGDLNQLPLAPRSFAQVASFQVIEHLADPSAYLKALRALVQQDGEVVLTTPNLKTSLGVNPYHLHEYTADELGGRLSEHFERVEVLGVGASAPVARYLAGRRERIQRIMRLDPLGLRHLLPRGLIELLFARFAILVRRGIQRSDGLPDVSWRDFPIGPVADDCVDLLAICGGPR